MKARLVFTDDNDNIRIANYDDLEEAPPVIELCEHVQDEQGNLYDNGARKVLERLSPEPRSLVDSIVFYQEVSRV